MDKWLLPGQSSIKERIIRHADIVEYSWVKGSISKRSPISIEIHPTNRCNLKCKFCSYGHVRFGEYLSEEVFEKLIDDLILCTPLLKSALFSGGGEPSINPYLPTAINRLVVAGVEVSVISNGVHMTDELFQAYQKCTWLRFSIDVPKETTYASLMSPHKPGNFRKVIENMRSLAEAKQFNKYAFPTLGLGFIITKDTQSDEDIFQCLDIGAKAGADYIMYRPLVDHDEEQITRPLVEYQELIPKVEEYAKKLSIVHQFKNFVRDFERTVQRRVPVIQTTCPIVQDGIIAFVAATGDVVPCCAIYMERMDLSWSFGNINESSFLDIWNGALREEVIRKIDATKCPFCRFQGHNKILFNMAQGETPKYECELDDKHWKFL